jgi:hypothetical protein
MSTTKMRVEIPTNPKSLLDLAKEIYDKHLEIGSSSPLSSIEDNNWTTEGPKIQACLNMHNEAEQLKGQMEKAYKDRDLLLLGIDKAVKASRDVLSGINHSNMKRLTDWGFSVIEAAKNSSDKKDDVK